MSNDSRRGTKGESKGYQPSKDSQERVAGHQPGKGTAVEATGSMLDLTKSPPKGDSAIQPPQNGKSRASS